jgi:hypothetical protein
MRRVTFFLLLMVLYSWVGSAGSELTVKGLQYPRIVARFHRFGQTSAIPPTPIYTPSRWGIFSVSTVMVLATSNGQDGGWLGNLAYTNGSGAGNASAPPYILGMLQNPGGIAQGITVVVQEPNRPLTFSTSSQGNISGSKYNVFIVVEQIQ